MSLHHKNNRTSALLVVIFLLSACSGQVPTPLVSSATPTAVAPSSTSAPTFTALPSLHTHSHPAHLRLDGALPAGRDARLDRSRSGRH